MSPTRGNSVLMAVAAILLLFAGGLTLPAISLPTLAQSSDQTDTTAKSSPSNTKKSDATAETSSAKKSSKPKKSAASDAPAPAPSSPSPPPPAPGKTTTSPRPPAPPANSSGMVWVNTDSRVYHKPGSRYYGKTAQGKYMTEADAIKAGYRAAAKN